MAKQKQTTNDIVSNILGNKKQNTNSKKVEEKNFRNITYNSFVENESNKTKVETMTKENESRYPVHSPRRVNGKKKDGTTISVIIRKEDYEELKKFLRYEEDNNFGSGQKSVLLEQVIHDWVEKNLRPYSEK